MREATMQATPISNQALASAPNSAAAALPFDPQASSPFTAIFQAVLSDAGNAGKFPAAGKAQDSSREPGRSTAAASNWNKLKVQGQAAPSLAPIFHVAFHAGAAAPSTPAAPVDSGIQSAHVAATMTNLLSSEATTGLSANIFQNGADSPANAVTAATPPSSASASDFVNAPAAFSEQVPAGATGGGFLDGAWGLSSELPNQVAPDAPANFPQNGATAATDKGLQLNPPSTASTSANANTANADAISEELVAAVAVVPNGFELQPVSDLSAGNSQTDANMQDRAAGAVAAQSQSSTSHTPAATENDSTQSATPQQILLAPASVSDLVPHDAGLALVPSGPQGRAANSSFGSQNSSSAASIQFNAQIAQSNRANAAFLNSATLIPSSTSAKFTVNGASQLAQNQLAQTNSQVPANPPPSPVETLAHSAAKSAAVGAATFKFHENAASAAANLPSPSPVAAAAARTQSQDTSSGSSGNDTSTKTERPSSPSNAPADAKNFVQSLGTAAAAPATGHAVAADANAVPAAAPAQPQSTNPGTQTGASSGADPKPAEPLPVAPQNAPVVNAAHIVNQPGQTEIRIEMQADSLGGVELRAHIAGDQIGASIAVEHHDIQAALATDLPALHSALVEKNLRVETLTVSQGNFSSLGGSSQDQGQRNFMQSPAKPTFSGQPETAQAFMETPAEWAAAAGSSAGLSVVA